MTRILTVDDSRAIRTIVSRQVAELGYEVGEAEDGEQGLAKLESEPFDLVLLDVTMPVLDGPGMLRRMREGGNKTPVIMLTSESKHSIVADLMRLGIDDYILKPFKPEELHAKIQKILGARSSSSAGGATSAAGQHPTVDVLCIDDMENVHKKLRSLLPAALTMDGVQTGQSALALSKDKTYRLILIDTVIPETDSVALMRQMKVLHPRAAIAAMPLKTQPGSEVEALKNGFVGVLMKPFDPDGVGEFLGKHLDTEDVLSLVENVIKCGPFVGKEDPARLDKYFKRITVSIKARLEEIAGACFSEAIFDVTHLSLQPARIPRLIIEIQGLAEPCGLQLKLVGTPEMAKLLTTFVDTASVPFYVSVDLAQAA